jgi:hypothetical protein
MFNPCTHKYNGHKRTVLYQHTTLINQRHSTRKSKDKKLHKHDINHRIITYSIEHHVYIRRYRGVWEDEPLYTRRRLWRRWQWRWWREQREAHGDDGGGGAGSTGIMGEHRPLAPFLHGFLGALPHIDGIHGGGKKMAFGGCNSWVEESPTSQVSSLYIASWISVTPSRVVVDWAYLSRPDSESVKFYA